MYSVGYKSLKIVEKRSGVPIGYLEAKKHRKSNFRGFF
jgi:hypothetical protein